MGRYKTNIKKEQENRRALAEFRKTPRLVCVQFRHDDIEGHCALHISLNEEPEQTVMCANREYVEFMKQIHRDRGCDGFCDWFAEHEIVDSPWGPKRRRLE